MGWLSQVLCVWKNHPYSKSTPKWYNNIWLRYNTTRWHFTHLYLHSPYLFEILLIASLWVVYPGKNYSPQLPNQGSGAWNNHGHVCGWDEIRATRQLNTGSSFKISHPNSIIQIHWSLTDLEHIIHIQLTGTIFTPHSSLPLFFFFFSSLFQSFPKQEYIKPLSSELSDVGAAIASAREGRAGLAL